MDLTNVPDAELARRVRLIMRPGRKPDHHWRDRLILAFGRWGTCVACPRENQFPRIDLCEHTERYDHNLSMGDE